MSMESLRITDPVGWLIRTIAEWGLEHVLGRYYGIYRAIVVDVADPEKRGRCRVLVPALGHEDAEHVSKDIWALPCQSGLSVGVSGVHGVFVPPNLEDQVWVQFENGKPELPIYMGGWIPNNNKSGLELQHAESRVKGIRTVAGHYLSFDDDKVEITLARGNGKDAPSGAMVKFTDNGSFTVVADDGATVTMDVETKEVTVSATDGCVVRLGNDRITLENKSGTTVDLNGGNVKIKASGNIDLSAGVKITVQAPLVDVGFGPVFESAVTGETLSALFDAHMHVVTAPGAATSPAKAVSIPVVKSAGLSIGVRVSK